MDRFADLLAEASARLRNLDPAAPAAVAAELRDRIIPELREHDPVVAHAVAVELVRRLRASAPRRVSPLAVRKASPRGDSLRA